MQDVTTFGDEQIIQTQAIFASFGMTEEQIRRSSDVALDFAAATGRALPDAANAVAKAFAGQTDILREMGIAVDKTKSQSEQFEEALQKLSGRFGGEARLATETYTGSLKQMSNAWGDVMEAAGKLLGFLGGQGTKPFAGITKFFKWLVKFLGTDVILTIGEFRATWSEMLATVMEIGAKAFGVLAKLPGEMGKKRPPRSRTARSSSRPPRRR
jgi:hypothetical protein